jgi:ketosteroid isomerase-like protein
MTMKLPTAIAGYFAADRDHDAAAMSRRFTENAVVNDDGKLHTGREAIQTWMSQAWKKYSATTAPFEIAKQGVATVVTCHVEGDFAGSPVDLRYHFVLEDDLIATLEISL